MAKFDALAIQKNIQLTTTDANPYLYNSIKAKATKDENPALRITMAMHSKTTFWTISFLKPDEAWMNKEAKNPTMFRRKMTVRLVSW